MQPVIICVDDDETVLTTLKEQLKNHLKGEYVIEVAESGEEALELLDELVEEGIEIPVFITDQIMPGMKGDSLLKLVHALLPRTLKILLTGQASADAVGNALNYAKLYRYIGKPWDEIDLTLTVKEAIRSYFQNKDLEEKNRELKTLNRELGQKVEAFYRFVPIQFLELLQHKTDFEHIALGACIECHMTVMFSDIRSFTKLSEKMSPDENFRFLNSYLSHMGPIIRKHSGFIDKYIGDSIMGLFEKPDEALQASIDMLKHLESYNSGRIRAHYDPIQIGIGINSGDVILGTIGENNRIDTTVIGDVVNLSYRIESFTKLFGTPLLISEHNYNNLETPEKYSIRYVDRVKIKGRETLVGIFEVFDGDDEAVRDGKIKTMSLFREAVSLYVEKEYDRAGRLFQKCLDENPRDNPAQLYVKRCFDRDFDNMFNTDSEIMHFD